MYDINIEDLLNITINISRAKEYSLTNLDNTIVITDGKYGTICINVKTRLRATYVYRILYKNKIKILEIDKCDNNSYDFLIDRSATIRENLKTMFADSFDICLHFKRKIYSV